MITNVTILMVKGIGYKSFFDLEIKENKYNLLDSSGIYAIDIYRNK